MGFFSDIFAPKNINNSDVSIPAIMPSGAINQINRGILPTMKNDKIILTKDEERHFTERAIGVKEKVYKRY